MKDSCKQYVASFTQYTRRDCLKVQMLNIPLGRHEPVRAQTMTNTDTNDIDATVRQCIRSFNAGADYIRITAQGIKEAKALAVIKEKLYAQGYSNPLIADIHFNPKAADVALEAVEKIRINPGNYTDKGAFLTGGDKENDYEEGLRKMTERFTPLVLKCKELGKVMRIGANHGSLSSRIIDKYGNTPEGMAESVMEFLRICKNNECYNVVVSMKSSNTRVMVQATRLLVMKMKQESVNFPVHLGVTEAGEGEDGRVKSAVGIGALLNDGIGDTIRVSLTEDPEIEVPVAKKIIDYYKNRNKHGFILPVENVPVNPYEYEKRETDSVDIIGGDNPPIVIGFKSGEEAVVDLLICEGGNICFRTDTSKKYPLLTLSEYMNSFLEDVKFVCCKHKDFNEDVLKKLKDDDKVVFILETDNINGFAEQRALIFELMLKKCKVPVIVKRSYKENDLETLQLKAACDFGALFLDGLADGIWIDNEGDIPSEEIEKLSFSILQASRVRINKTEFISCPGCGRTQFNLQEATKNVKQRLSHLKGLKIAVMGCIVNGPGEMADADYGYVGAGAGKVSLYKGKNAVEKNILQEEALEKLIELIKDNGDWKD